MHRKCDNPSCVAEKDISVVDTFKIRSEEREFTKQAEEGGHSRKNQECWQKQRGMESVTSRREYISVVNSIKRVGREEKCGYTGRSSPTSLPCVRCKGDLTFMYCS